MKKPRLLGIEFVRILSSYAVIIVHSGDETWQLPIDASAINFRLFFYFGVPFFLAISFYFMTAKTTFIYSIKFWRSKVARILIPYAIWSLIFLVSRFIIFTVTNKTERLQQVLQDPLSLIFLGGASYQLYFLPLLFIGTLLVLTVPLLERLKINIFSLFFVATLSVVFYGLLEQSGNGFHLSANSTAFQNLIGNLKIDINAYQWLRLILVYSAWIIRCLPYLLIAFIFHKLHWEQKILNSRTTVAISWAILCLACNTLGKMFLPSGLSELLLAFSLLLFSISISKYFKNNTVINLTYSAGTCSFGIYLIHPFVMYVVKTTIGTVIPTVANSISIFSMLTISIICFLISWLIVAYLTRNKLISKYLFGV